MTLPDFPVWELAIFVCVVLLAVWFFQRIIQLEREKQPKIEIHTGTTAPFIVQMERGHGEGGTEYNIRLQNTGETILQSCKANIEKVNLQNGDVLSEDSYPLRRADTGNTVFPLRGGEKKFVNLFATLNGGFVRGKFFLGYHNRLYSHQIPSANYRMVVAVYAEQGRPTEVVFDVTVESMGRLLLRCRTGTSEGGPKLENFSLALLQISPAMRYAFQFLGAQRNNIGSKRMASPRADQL